MNTIYQQVQDAYRNKLTLIIYWGLCTLVLIAAAIYLWWGDWQSAVAAAFIFALMLAPTIAKERYRLYLPFSLDLGIIAFIFLTLFLGGVAHFYETVPLWDKFLHFQSGFLLGATGYLLVYTLNEHKRTHLNLSPGFVSLFAVAFSLCIGAAWEIFEFAADAIFHTTIWQGASLPDTMVDLMADGAGALIFSIAGYFWMYRYKRLPFTPLLLRKVREKLREMKARQ